MTQMRHYYIMDPAPWTLLSAPFEGTERGSDGQVLKPIDAIAMVYGGYVGDTCVTLLWYYSHLYTNPTLPFVSTTMKVTYPCRCTTSNGSCSQKDGVRVTVPVKYAIELLYRWHLFPVFYSAWSPGGSRCALKPWLVGTRWPVLQFPYCFW